MPEEGMNYVVISQDLAEVQDLASSPVLAMSAYLEETGQQDQLRRISIYSERGTTAGTMRLLYMNREALAIWRSMGRQPTIVGERHRPPRSALLGFGVPFSA